jgi:hypothetical protein
MKSENVKVAIGTALFVFFLLLIAAFCYFFLKPQNGTTVITPPSHPHNMEKTHK